MPRLTPNLKPNLVCLLDNPNFTILDFKDWLIDAPEGTPALKKLLIYHCYASSQCPDADVVLKISNEDGCILENLGWYPSTLDSGKQYLDCIFSSRTFVGAFLRFFAKGLTWEEIRDKFDQLFSAENIAMWAYEQSIDKNMLGRLIVQLERFARNTHTIGNYMPCIDSKYNSYKGFGFGYTLFKDCLERFYQELESPLHSEYMAETRSFYKQRFTEIRERLHLERILGNPELLKFTFNYRTMNKDTLNPYLDYLTLVNDIIEDRGKKLILI